MVKNISAQPTGSAYVKVANVAGLYRHARTGLYYGSKKLHGRRKDRSLRTTDRKIAERRLREWLRNLQNVDRELERMTLEQLLQKFVAANQGKSAKTQATNRSMMKQLHNTWSHGLDVEVRHIKASHLDEWLAHHEKRLKNTSYNRYAGFLKQLFDIAVRDQVIIESPFTSIRTAWKRPQEPVRLVPTAEQFIALVENIRVQRFTRYASATADFVEFLGRAGLGQAEAASLTWGDVDWELERLSIRRHKTGTRFHVPLYPDLKQLLVRLQKKAESTSAKQPLFAIKDAKKALRAACLRLGFPNFSQRSLRRCCICQLWRSGVDKKLIAKWQGHQDGGQLIIDTYTEVFGDDDLTYERQQLDKLCPGTDRS